MYFKHLHVQCKGIVQNQSLTCFYLITKQNTYHVQIFKYEPEHYYNHVNL